MARNHPIEYVKESWLGSFMKQTTSRMGYALYHIIRIQMLLAIMLGSVLCMPIVPCGKLGDTESRSMNFAGNARTTIIFGCENPDNHNPHSKTFKVGGRNIPNPLYQEWEGAHKEVVTESAKEVTESAKDVTESAKEVTESAKEVAGDTAKIIKHAQPLETASLETKDDLPPVVPGNDVVIDSTITNEAKQDESIGTSSIPNNIENSFLSSNNERPRLLPNTKKSFSAKTDDSKNTIPVAQEITSAAKEMKITEPEITESPLINPSTFESDDEKTLNQQKLLK